jgi:hypothetical protein
VKEMKKGIFYLLIIMFIIALPGCKKDKPEESSQSTNFDISAAKNLVSTYMKNLMKENYENNKKLFVKELGEGKNNISNNDLKIKGYNITEVNEVGRSGIFKVKVTRTDMKKTSASLDEYSIKVIKDGAEYKISEINDTLEKECFLEGEGIRHRSKNDVKTNLVLDYGGIPQYAFSKDDKAQIYKNTVPKENFGSINLSFSGERLGFSTFGKDAYIGIVLIDESLAVQGETEAKSGSSQGGTGGSNIKAKEKPIGKEVVSLDLIKDSKLEFITFSLDEKFVLVQYMKPSYGRCIRVYKTNNGELIPIKFEGNYDLDKVEIIFSSFDKDVLNYEVVAKGSMDKSQGDIVGIWRLDLKEFKVKKL